MDTKSADSIPANDSTRCQHRFRTGARCRLPVLSSSTACCHRHSKLRENQRMTADLSDSLTAGLAEFKSPAQINDFLSRLLLLLAQDRISPRRAAVLAYITNQILHTLAAMQQEAADAKDPKKHPVKVIWDMPCPPHEKRDQP